MLLSSFPGRVLGDLGDEDPLRLAWSARWPMAATRAASPSLPLRLSSFEEEAAPVGGASVSGAAPVASVLFGQGALGPLAGGAVVASVLLGRGGLGSLQVGSAAPPEVGLAWAGHGVAQTAGEASPLVQRHAAEGDPGDRLRACMGRGLTAHFATPRIRVVVLAEAP